MAAPTLQAQGTATANTTGNLTVNLPAYAADDIVVITTVGFVPNTATGTATQSLSSPWTKNSPDVTVITSNLIDEEHACWWARATSNSSLGTSVTITRPANWDTGTDTCWYGRAYVIRGCVTTGDPYDEFASTALTTIANPVLPAITVAGGNRLALVFMTKADNTTLPTAATGYTVGTVNTTNTGTDAGMQSYRQVTSANLGTVTPTGGQANAANNGNSCYFEFAFIPEPVTATASAALGNIGTSVSGTVTKIASGSAALGNIGTSVTGTVSKVASGAAPLGALSASATGTVLPPPVTGVADAPLGALASSASAVVSKVASAAAPLGGLSASASATIIEFGVADAPLGGLSSSASGIVSKVGSADAPLGGLSASAIGDVIGGASASAQLGGLAASASGVVTVAGSASAALGGLLSSGSATVSKVASADAPLGGLTASATGEVVADVVAVAALGGVTGSASGVVTVSGLGSAALGGLTAVAVGPVTPPSPAGGEARPNPYLQPRRKKQPIKKAAAAKARVVVAETPAPKLVKAFGKPTFVGLKAKAEGKVTFSAEEDDLQVLLML